MALFGRKSRAPRRKTNQEAWMAIDGTFAARRCSVLDISEGGAKIKIDDPTFVRPVFQLNSLARTKAGVARFHGEKVS
ncbi:MAG: hypothetical protein QOJ15_7373 [Bradyrhizobium sp.]|jgi:hypothetical protein|nr:hypothetical protein [Bradyrhizobium sp.]